MTRLKMTYVLMPGLDGTGRLFEPLQDAVGDRAELVTVRYPEDEVLTYDELLLRVERLLPTVGGYMLIAESFSGPLALALAARTPEGLAGVVLCNTFVTPPVWRGLGIAPLSLLMRLSLPDLLLRRYLVGDDASASMLERARAATEAVSPAVLAARIDEVLRVDARAWLEACRAPLLYLRGEHDRLVPERCLEEILQLRPQAAVARIDGPHLLLQAAPMVCAQRIEAFARKVER
jgi:pimeloyl-[acyl-carrier protein] methyl ester esterase